MLTGLLSFVLGAITWSFTEYGLHNWYGHLAKGRNEFSREHLSHHANTRYFGPTRKKVVVASALITPCTIALTLLAGVCIGVSAGAGFTITYAAYEVLHRRCHTHAPRGPYGRWARRHHFSHHFSSPKSNHGVTSPLWDHVFRTYQQPQRIRLPRRQAMDWLLDHDGNVDERWREDYELAGTGTNRDQNRDTRAA